MQQISNSQSENDSGLKVSIREFNASEISAFVFNDNEEKDGDYHLPNVINFPVRIEP